MQRMIPLHQEVRPLPAAELEKVAELIRTAQRDRTSVRVDVPYLADVVRDFPVLFSEEYQNRFPGL